jgi:hypothetical protein
MTIDKDILEKRKFQHRIYENVLEQVGIISVLARYKFKFHSGDSYGGIAITFMDTEVFYDDIIYIYTASQSDPDRKFTRVEYLFNSMMTEVVGKSLYTYDSQLTKCTRVILTKTYFDAWWKNITRTDCIMNIKGKNPFFSQLCKIRIHEKFTN